MGKRRPDERNWRKIRVRGKDGKVATYWQRKDGRKHNRMRRMAEHYVRLAMKRLELARKHLERMQANEYTDSSGDSQR